jgi:ribonuclease BN (tRNA processing enzyme)
VPPLEVIVLGVGDAFSEIHHPSSLLLLYEGFHLAIDCPDMYRRVLRDAAEKSERPLRIFDVDHVLITHVHGDHIGGLEGLGFYKYFHEKKRLRLLAAPEVSAGLWESRLRIAMGSLWNGVAYRGMVFDDYFELLPLSTDRETTVGPFRIRTHRTRHHVPTTALLVEAGDAVLGYSSDTAFDPKLISFLEPADLILHESNRGPAHTPYVSLLSLPEAVRARIRLIHLPDDLDQEACPFPIVEEGEVLRIGGAPREDS